MFKIHYIDNREIAESIYPSLGENEMLFALNEEGIFKGTAICENEGETVIIKRVDAPYEDARLLMFLAMLNYAERHKMKMARCINSNLADLCERMHFEKDMTVSLEGFFIPGRHCKD